MPRRFASFWISFKLYARNTSRIFLRFRKATNLTIAVCKSDLTDKALHSESCYAYSLSLSFERGS